MNITNQEARIMLTCNEYLCSYRGWSLYGKQTPRHFAKRVLNVLLIANAFFQIYFFSLFSQLLYYISLQYFVVVVDFIIHTCDSKPWNLWALNMLLFFIQLLSIIYSIELFSPFRSRNKNGSCSKCAQCHSRTRRRE